VKWKKARKKPVVVEFREPIPNFRHRVESEEIQTPEGPLYAVPGMHYVIRGVKGELYPIEKEIFEETYEVIDDDESPPEKISESLVRQTFEVAENFRQMSIALGRLGRRIKNYSPSLKWRLISAMAIFDRLAMCVDEMGKLLQDLFDIFSEKEEDGE